MTQHVWIGERRYLMTDDFDATPESEDMKALHQLDEFITGRLNDPDVQADLERRHLESHERRCCTEHGTHSTPHRGCILR